MSKENNLKILYNFYLENCVDEKEIPLSFNDWRYNYGNEELANNPNLLTD